ncbi:hypothetical protein [Priestia abyssalis]|uniref:hypothetical protein n=1 Tax=Priestia abyssalis TaxID=1221450 RepID=UPI0009951045|nr:hypothetical protein [Priestia abyssalis]
MFDNVDKSVINGLALSLGTLFVTILVFCLVPALILDRIGVPKKIVDSSIGLFGLLGFACWIYAMFYLNLSKLFI